MRKGKFSKSRTPQQENRELEQALREAADTANGAKSPKTPGNKKSEHPSAAKKRRIAWTAVGIAAIVLALCLGIGLWYYFSSTADDGKIYSNVYAAGINLGGMRPEEAQQALLAVAGNTYPETALIIETQYGPLGLNPADTGAALDIPTLVSDAYAYGREGGRSQRAKARADAALTTHTLELLPYLNLDTGYIRAAIDDFAERHSSTLTQPSVTLTGEKPELEEIPEDPKAALQTLKITMGTPGVSLDTQALYNDVLDAYNQNRFAIQAKFTVVEPEAPVVSDLYTATYVAPIDAVVDKSNYTIIPEIWGYGFDLQAAKDWISAAHPGQSTELPLIYLPPAVTADDLEIDLFPDTLATFDSPYNAGNTSRSTNLELSAAAINGTILEPGEVFSFNGIVGERTPEKGYQGAPAYVGGETVDQVGGGICQVASTIYYCTLLADLEILEREEHMFAATYVPMGMDATINWGTIDFKFRNNTGHPLRIDCWASGGYVHVALMGADTKDYYVDMEYVIDKQYDWVTEERVMDPDNEYGYEDGDVIQDPYTGYDVRTFQCKYSKATDELISRDYEATSNFEWRNQIVCKIRVPETEPPATEPPATDPPETEPPTEEEP